MNRREFAKKASAVSAAVAVLGVTELLPQGHLGKLGYVKAGRLVRCGSGYLSTTEIGVRVNGIDCSNRCHEANDTEGWARVFDRDANGKYFVREGEDRIAQKVITGHVEFYRL